MAIRMEVWGDYACFTRPELKVERVCYDVMTPSAARGMLEAVFWHPGMCWHIDKIHIMNPIKFTNIRRNEVKSKVSHTKARSAMTKGGEELFIATSDDIVQRAALVLQDVHYVIDAHFEMTDKANATDNEGKFSDMARRRLEKGQCYHQMYFGTREFPAYFKKWAGGEIPAINETRDLGLMLYDMDYSDCSDIKPMFFRAQLRDGVLDVRDCEVFR